MNIKVNDILSQVVGYLSEAVTTEHIKFDTSKNSDDVVKILEMLTDIRFQVDFTLMSSAIEVQELYDKYRNRPTEESNIEIRTLMDLANYIHILVCDDYERVGHTTQWDMLINRLAQMVSLHSNVLMESTCQDESITNGMDTDTWKTLLNSNPWLVAAVCIRLIPGYYILNITLNDMDTKNEDVK